MPRSAVLVVSLVLALPGTAGAVSLGAPQDIPGTATARGNALALAADAQGGLTAAFFVADGGTTDLRVSERPPGGAWSVPVTVETGFPGVLDGLLDGFQWGMSAPPQLHVTPTGRAVLAWRNRDSTSDRGGLRIAVRPSPGAPFGPARTAAPSTSGDARVTISPGGDVAWAYQVRDTAATPDVVEVRGGLLPVGAAWEDRIDRSVTERHQDGASNFSVHDVAITRPAGAQVALPAVLLRDGYDGVEELHHLRELPASPGTFSWVPSAQPGDLAAGAPAQLDASGRLAALADGRLAAAWPELQHDGPGPEPDRRVLRTAVWEPGLQAVTVEAPFEEALGAAPHPPGAEQLTLLATPSGALQLTFAWYDPALGQQQVRLAQRPAGGPWPGGAAVVAPDRFSPRAALSDAGERLLAWRRLGPDPAERGAFGVTADTFTAPLGPEARLLPDPGGPGIEPVVAGGGALAVGHRFPDPGAGIRVRATAGSGGPGPVAPSLAGTDPLPPSNVATPRVRGSAPAGTTVRVFASATCTGTPLATGTAAGLAGPGLQVTVPENATTQLSATATDAGGTSPCSAPIAYAEDSVAPAPPVLSATNPPSPANASQPNVLGTAEAGSRVRVFGQNGCAGPLLGIGPAATLQAGGIQVTVTPNAATSLRATAEDAAGNVSGCSAPLTYVENSALPSQEQPLSGSGGPAPSPSPVPPSPSPAPPAGNAVSALRASCPTPRRARRCQVQLRFAVARATTATVTVRRIAGRRRIAVGSLRRAVRPPRAAITLGRRIGRRVLRPGRYAVTISAPGSRALQATVRVR